jgi:hypothetical protein
MVLLREGCFRRELAVRQLRRCLTGLQDTVELVRLEMSLTQTSSAAR